MQYYLSGPMTGYPHFNFPRFDDVAKLLRSGGFNIVSPAELDEGPLRDASMESTTGDVLDTMHLPDSSWGELIARDIEIIVNKCQGIIVMDRWYESRGARLELFAAMQCGHEMFWFEADTLNSMCSQMAMSYLHQGMFPNEVK